MRMAAKIFGALAGLLLVILLLGLLLPGDWEAQADGWIQAPPDEVFPLIDGMAAFSRWSPNPGSGLVFFGPSRGAGSGMRWDDPAYGEGQVVITRSETNGAVAYQVLVEGGALEISGVISLTAEGEGTRVRWRETGDFGWNPLLGFTARGMARSQGEAMGESLKGLGGLVTGANPGDEGSPGS